MTSKLGAFFDIFKNLKSDAVPRPARPKKYSESDFSKETDSEKIYTSQENFKESKKSKNKHKYKTSFSEPNQESSEYLDDDDLFGSNVNTHANGNVINIVNSNNVHCGNVYNMGSGNFQPRATKTMEFEEEEEEVEMTNYIKLLLEANTKLEHEYMDYISKNLGKNWYSFFRKLGYKQGWIETLEQDMAKQGIAQVRYKLLLDWVRNDDDGTLGKMATTLWESGERSIVKEMAAMYNH